MAAVALLTSTTASLPPQVVERYGITLIPFTIQFLDGNFKEGVDISLAEFYARLEHADPVPSTLPTTVPQFMQFFKQLGQQADTVLVFHISPVVSKAYANASHAAERTAQPRVINIDTGTFSIGTGLLVIQAAEAIAGGQSADEAARLVSDLAPHVMMLSSPSSMRFLRMSGRIGRLPAMAASLIGIQPVLKLAADGSGLEVVARPRSPEAARATMIDQAAAFVGAGRTQALGITHTNNLATAELFQQEVSQRFPGVPIYLAEAGPSLAVHSGPGALGLAVLRAL